MVGWLFFWTSSFHSNSLPFIIFIEKYNYYKMQWFWTAEVDVQISFDFETLVQQGVKQQNLFENLSFLVLQH